MHTICFHATQTATQQQGRGRVATYLHSSSGVSFIPHTGRRRLGAHTPGYTRPTVRRPAQREYCPIIKRRVELERIKQGRWAQQLPPPPRRVGPPLAAFRRAAAHRRWAIWRPSGRGRKTAGEDRAMPYAPAPSRPQTRLQAREGATRALCASWHALSTHGPYAGMFVAYLPSHPDGPARPQTYTPREEDRACCCARRCSYRAHQCAWLVLARRQPPQWLLLMALHAHPLRSCTCPVVVAGVCVVADRHTDRCPAPLVEGQPCKDVQPGGGDADTASVRGR